MGKHVPLHGALEEEFETQGGVEEPEDPEPDGIKLAKRHTDSDPLGLGLGLAPTR